MIRILVQKHKNKYIPCFDSQNSLVLIRQSLTILSLKVSPSDVVLVFLSMVDNSITGDVFLKINLFVLSTKQMKVQTRFYKSQLISYLFVDPYVSNKGLQMKEVKPT